MDELRNTQQSSPICGERTSKNMTIFVSETVRSVKLSSEIDYKSDPGKFYCCALSLLGKIEPAGPDQPCVTWFNGEEQDIRNTSSKATPFPILSFPGHSNSSDLPERCQLRRASNSTAIVLNDPLLLLQAPRNLFFRPLHLSQMSCMANPYISS